MPGVTAPDKARLAEILALVGDDLVKVEREFDRHLGSDIEIIETVGRYIAEGGGKRIRPALFLLCSRLCGYSRWGSHLTVLLGDYLYLKSMTLALTADELRIIRTLCDITLTMIEGELMQADCNGAIDLTEAEHLEIIRRKTAVLFSGCGRVAAELALVGPEQALALEAYALNLGMAYQLVDDLLDFTATESVLGKPVASDLKEGRLTLPLIYLLEKGVAEHRQKIGAVLRDGGFTTVDCDEILDMVNRHGTLERTRLLAVSYSRKAAFALDAFEPTPVRQALKDLARFVTLRDH
jgi:octaprenyl-diphosphate synthase